VHVGLWLFIVMTAITVGFTLEINHSGMKQLTWGGQPRTQHILPDISRINNVSGVLHVTLVKPPLFVALLPQQTWNNSTQNHPEPLRMNLGMHAKGLDSDDQEPQSSGKKRDNKQYVP